MGGVPPLGYDPHPDKSRRELVLNETEARIVQKVFALYDAHSCLNVVTRKAKDEGLRSKHHHFSTGREQGNRPFGRGQIYHILRNPTYLGRIRHKEKSFPGLHEAIIDQALWDRVQSKLESAAVRRRGVKTIYQKGAQTGVASLLGKFRDETGDILTPSHSQKGKKRHRYYISNRLITGKPDRAAWRLPARAFEDAVAGAIARHLKAAAQRHEILCAMDVVASSQATETALTLTARMERSGVGIAAGLIERGTIGKGSLAVTLIASSLSEALGLPASELHPSLLHIEAPLHCRRRGAEMKIIAGDIQSLPDKALIRALNNAHIWVRQMKTGVSVKQIAATSSISESYVTRVITLAFLSPRIQRAILAGTQPDGLTMETLVRRCIPRHWPDQEKLYGIGSKP
ncbi:Recombinase [Shimia gijangensis]|uniref:Recombinase n=1 Tax=Shimia gijangensis TaxID=1470563 RepID=A0A1M6QW05_9RHOB|nr:recombinase family protein [Shimia gijangensis]SHK24421.1 Recombinase [Shimia gijangensis]